MAGKFERSMGSKGGSFTQLVQVTEEEVLYIHTHVVSMANSSTTAGPCDWFADREHQELLTAVYDIVLKKTKEGDASTESTDYQFKRGRNLRIFYKFKKLESRQHLVVPQSTNTFSKLIPQAMFVSNEGRKVLPFLDQRTYGSGYKSYRIHGDYLEVFVDGYSISDPRGIFKIRSKLNPGSQLGPDITAFFQPPSFPDMAIDDICSLSEILALKTTRHTRKGATARGGSRGKGRGGRGKGAEARGALKDCSNTRSAPSSKGKSGIGAYFDKQQEANSASGGCDGDVLTWHTPAPETGPEAGTYLTKSDLGDFDSFSSQEDGGPTGTISLSDLKHFIPEDDETPPLSPAGPAHMDHAPSASPPPHDNSGYMDCDDNELPLKHKPSRHEPSPDLTGEGVVDMSGLSGLSDISTPEGSYFTYVFPSDSADSNPAVPECGETLMCTSGGSTSAHVPLPSGQVSESEGAKDTGSTISTVSTVSSASTLSSVSSGDRDVISILSSSDEEGSGPAPGKGSSDGQPARVRKKLKSAKDVFKGTESVADITTKQVRQWICRSKPLLVDIFKRSIFSQRHEDFYFSGKKRQAMKYQLDTQMFQKEHVELVTSLLLHVFCGRNMRYFSYVMSVLLPECMIRILADVNNIDFAQAEEMIIN